MGINLSGYNHALPLLRPDAALRDTETVPEYCSCGVQLPPDARFCHKCGRPQYDDPALETEAEPQVVTIAPPVIAAPPPEINFHNTAAVRVGFLAAGIASLLITVPLPAVFAMGWLLVWLLASGFLAVWLYRRRTGQELSVRSGMRMGWITGIFCFVIATLFFTISVLTISSKGGLAAFYREQFSARGAVDANVEEFLKVLQNPAGVATVILLSLFFVFIFFTLLPAIGGALGAKVLEKD